VDYKLTTLNNLIQSYPTTEYSSGLNIILPVFVGTSRIKSIRSYIQPSIGVTSEYFDIAFSPRLTSFYVYNVENNINVELGSGSYAENESNTINGMKNHKKYFFFDPAVTIRGGWRYIKLQAQYSYNVPIGYCNFDYKESNFSLGVYFAYSKYYFNTKNSRY